MRAKRAYRLVLMAICVVSLPVLVVFVLVLVLVWGGSSFAKIRRVEVL